MVDMPIYLTGMPGAGKSTIGRLLAQRLHVPFCDLDEVVAEQAGCSIREIFEGEGEDGFRARESAALQAIAHRGVIATGGGILLREENHTWLHRGWIIYIDRPLCQIASDLRTKERPLFGAGACLQTLYAQRAALYAAHCDLRMENRSTPEDAVECAAAWIMCKQNRMENASCKM